MNVKKLENYEFTQEEEDEAVDALEAIEDKKPVA